MSNAIKKILNDPNLLEQVTKRCFDSVDTDKSGKIETKELKEILIQISMDFKAEPPTDEEVKGVLDQLDTDKSGTVELKEFEVLIADLLKAMLEQ